MNFAQAFDALREGKRVARLMWTQPGARRPAWIQIVVAKVLGEESAPFIVMKRDDGKLAPWTPSQTAILAEDWILVV
jgi:Protein of unknown function (DUF2829)